MDFNKLTRKSQEALSEAQGIAIGNNNQEVDVAHLSTKIGRASCRERV